MTIHAAPAGRVALVTGAAMGIGAAIATQLAADGIMVIVSDLNSEAAENTAARLRAAGHAAASLALDVGRPESIAAIASFLASDQAAYISGTTIPVDGGFMASGARGA